MSKGPLGAGRFPQNRSPQHQQQQAREIVTAGLHNGTVAPIKDRFGTELRVGDLVVARPDPDPVFQIMDITPVMDPGAPPGMVRVHLQTTLPIVLRMGTMVPSMMRVGRVPEAEAADAEPSARETILAHEGPVQDLLGPELTELVESGQELMPDPPSPATE